MRVSIPIGCDLPPAGDLRRGRPLLRQHLSLLQYGLRRLLLLVGRISVLPKDASDEHAELRANSSHQLPRDHAERVVAQHLHGTVVLFERAVEGQLILGEAERLAAARWPGTSPLPVLITPRLPARLRLPGSDTGG